MTKAVSSGVKTREMFRMELNGPLYCGLVVSTENAYMTAYELTIGVP
ncbi:MULTISPECIES: hypothetical protein [Paraburkholderia]|uniref:Uncharacterized protein n=1 Tax=Paraburkholderia dipogonis TaxID=1211383 RepID=A0ABW9AZP3_9BURK